jgi:pseudouridine-5'-phosphate glycosidase
MDYNTITNAIESALKEAKEKNITGKKVTPFLLDKVKTITDGKSLDANIELVYNNAKVAAQIAKDLSELK